MLIYKEFEPPEPLSKFIKCFWILERLYDAETPSENVLPDSYIEFILNFGSRYYLEREGDLPSIFMIGLLKRPLPFYANGKVKLVCIRFYPWGPFSLLGSNIKETINTKFNLNVQETLLDSLGEHLNQNEYEEAVKCLSDFILEIYLRKNFDKNTVDSAAQILYRDMGEVRIEELAKMCNVTQRTLQRNFNNRLGISPKSYASNVRFDTAKKKLSHNPNMDLTVLAHESGYYDQAHFIRDFKIYCGCTPSEFAAGILQMAEIFTDKKNVVFLQSDSDDLN